MRERDADMPEKQAPEGIWDEQTAAETFASATFCYECHGAASWRTS